jgi:hypothetical protein
LNSRFLFCKHILFCYEPISDRIDFFRFVQRHREPPFWTHRELVLQPRYRPSPADPNVNEADNINIDDEDIDPVAVGEDEVVITEEEEEEEDVDADGNRFASDLQLAVDIFREQQAKGNEKFVRKFMTMYGSIQTFVEEVKALENRRTMRRTWDAWKNSLTMYYN